MSKKDIFNFNHIHPNIDTEKLKQIQDLYAYYHKITWIYRPCHKRNKKINYSVHIASVLLASVGVITGSDCIRHINNRRNIKSYHEFKNIKGKTDLLKFSVTSC